MTEAARAVVATVAEMAAAAMVAARAVEATVEATVAGAMEAAAKEAERAAVGKAAEWVGRAGRMAAQCSLRLKR